MLISPIALEQLAVRLGDAVDLLRGREQRAPVVGKDAVPRWGAQFGELAQRRRARNSELSTRLGHAHRSLELDPPDLAEHALDLARRVREPACAARGQHELLLLELEHEELEELTLPPQDVGHVAERHLPDLVPVPVPSPSAGPGRDMNDRRVPYVTRRGCGPGGGSQGAEVRSLVGPCCCPLVEKRR
jgi:hypothetical protein